MRIAKALKPIIILASLSCEIAHGEVSIFGTSDQVDQSNNLASMSLLKKTALKEMDLQKKLIFFVPKPMIVDLEDYFYLISQSDTPRSILQVVYLSHFSADGSRIIFEFGDSKVSLSDLLALFRDYPQYHFLVMSDTDDRSALRSRSLNTIVLPKNTSIAFSFTEAEMTQGDDPSLVARRFYQSLAITDPVQKKRIDLRSLLEKMNKGNEHANSKIFIRSGNDNSTSGLKGFQVADGISDVLILKDLLRAEEQRRAAQRERDAAQREKERQMAIKKEQRRKQKAEEDRQLQVAREQRSKYVFGYNCADTESDETFNYAYDATQRQITLSVGANVDAKAANFFPSLNPFESPEDSNQSDQMPGHTIGVSNLQKLLVHSTKISQDLLKSSEGVDVWVYINDRKPESMTISVRLNDSVDTNSKTLKKLLRKINMRFKGSRVLKNFRYSCASVLDGNGLEERYGAYCSSCKSRCSDKCADVKLLY